MTKPTVLVVDDEKDVLELLRYVFSGAGFEVIGVTTGESGFSVACTRSPDVILLDVMLPGLDGFDIVRLLRNHDATWRVPVIMLSARASEADQAAGLGLGADEYITKPFSPQELVTRVRAALSRGLKVCPSPGAQP